MNTISLKNTCKEIDKNSSLDLLIQNSHLLKDCSTEDFYITLITLRKVWDSVRNVNVAKNISDIIKNAKDRKNDPINVTQFYRLLRDVVGRYIFNKEIEGHGR